MNLKKEYLQRRIMLKESIKLAEKLAPILEKYAGQKITLTQGNMRADFKKDIRAILDQPNKLFRAWLDNQLESSFHIKMETTLEGTPDLNGISTTSYYKFEFRLGWQSFTWKEDSTSYSYENFQLSNFEEDIKRWKKEIRFPYNALLNKIKKAEELKAKFNETNYSLPDYARVRN